MSSIVHRYGDLIGDIELDQPGIYADLNDPLQTRIEFDANVVSLQDVLNVDVHKRDSRGNTLLHLVLKQIHKGVHIVVKALLDEGVRVNQTTYSGQSPLHYAFKYINCPFEVVKLLLERGAEVNSKDIWDRIPIDYTIYKDIPFAVMKLLIDYGSDVHHIDANGTSLLHHAILNKHATIKVVQLLLDKGVSLQEESIEGESVVHLAVEYMRTEILELLLKQPSIKINRCDKSGYTPLHHAVSTRKCKPEVVKLLLDYGAKVNMKAKHGAQALHMAMLWCNVDVIKLLLEYGARVNVIEEYHRTPLYLAIKFGRFENIPTLKLLLENGALVFYDPPRLDVESPCHSNSSLYHAALLYGKLQNEFTIRRLQLVLKYALLERPNIEYGEYSENALTLNFLTNTGGEFARELHSTCNEKRETLGEFILRLRLKNDEVCHTDEILCILATNAYPLYREVIVNLLTREELIVNFQERAVYAANNETHETQPVKRVVLNFDSLCSLLKYLSKEELLNFMLAYYNTNNSHIDFPGPSSTSLHAIEAESKRFFKRARAV